MSERRKIYEADLPHRAVAVYLYLQDRANAEKTCYPAIGTIARELNLSVSTVKRAISDLEKNGFLRKKQRWRENGGRSSLLYEIKISTKGILRQHRELWYGSRWTMQGR